MDNQKFINEQQIDTEIRKLLSAELDSINRLGRDMFLNVSEIQKDNVYQRRDLLKHIILVAVAAIGLSPLSLNHLINKMYIIIGIALHIFIIVLILCRIRGYLDKEALGLQRLLDQFYEAEDWRTKLIYEYLHKDKLTLQQWQEYHAKIKDSKIYKQLNRNVAQARQKRQNRAQEPLDYFVEFIIFLFITASFFILISLFELPLKVYHLVGIILFFLVLSFLDIGFLALKPINGSMNFLRTKVKLKTFKSTDEYE